MREGESGRVGLFSVKIANIVGRWCVKGFVEIFYVGTLSIRSDADK